MSQLDASELDPEEALRLLEWYRDMGVDLAIGEEGRNRFSEAPARSQPAQSSSAGSAPSAPAAAAAEPSVLAASAEENVMAARTAAARAQTLDELRQLLEGFDGCALKMTATRMVFSDGAPGSRLMLVGEAPGRDEDREGKPFVGRSGQLLDKMLAAIGLDRTSVYIANVVPWRPPGNRAPTTQETQICLPFIRRQIELAEPDLVVFLGGSAAQTMLNTTDGILRLRGRWQDFQVGNASMKALATLHPAFLLRSPLQKRLAWRDFLAIKKALG